MKPLNRRRKILLLADFAYASAKAVAAGVVRFVSSRPELDLSIRGGHPGNADAAYAMESGPDGIISCLGTNVGELRRVLALNPNTPVVFASVARDLSSLPRRRCASILCDHAAIAGAAADLLVRHGLVEFGYVGSRLDPSAPSWNAERREAFVRALEERGFRIRVYEPSAAEEGAEAEDLRRSINSFLETCTEQQRCVFVRRYWYFDSISEIGGRYGFSQSKVKTMLFRLREGLRSHLEKEGYAL